MANYRRAGCGESRKSGSEGGGWKSAYPGNSLAAHPTSEITPFSALLVQPSTAPVAIGRASRPFPRSKPDRKRSLHPAFQKEGLMDRTGGIDSFPGGVGGPFTVETASNFSTTKAAIPCSGTSFLADLHHILPIPGRHWAPTPPPSSLPHAGIFASPRGGQAVWEFPSSNVRDITVTRSCLL
jgi:hypothetical protein